MAFCRNCGAEVHQNAYICTKCGALVNEGAIKSGANAFRAELIHHASFWLLFSGIIVFTISFFFLYYPANLWLGVIAFLLALIAFITAFNAERKNACSKTYIFTSLLITIVFFLFVFRLFLLEV